jgi:Zn-dependent membrane protease YugP
MRTALVPVVNIASPGAYLFLFAGLILNFPIAGLGRHPLLRAMAVLFSLVTSCR